MELKWQKSPDTPPPASRVAAPQQVSPSSRLKSWHFDPQTERRANPQKAYQLLVATDQDVKHVMAFYQHHPVAGYGINQVEVIYNRGFNQGFEVHLQKLQSRHKNPAFVAKWSGMPDADLRQETYQQYLQLTQPYTDSDYPHVRLMPVWHGTKPEVLGSLFSAGYANLATTDNGYFGKGYYGAYEAEYAYRVYSQGALILNWVASYSPLPVVNDDMKTLSLEGKSNYGNYDAHYVPVRPRFSDAPNETVYYPCQTLAEQQYTEMVVFESAALLPRYLVALEPEGLKLKSPVISSHSGMASQGWYQSIQSIHPNSVLGSPPSSHWKGGMKSSGSNLNSMGWYQSSVNQTEETRNSSIKVSEDAPPPPRQHEDIFCPNGKTRLSPESIRRTFTQKFMCPRSGT